MHKLKKPLNANQILEDGLIGKRGNFVEVEDQSLYTRKEGNDLENLVVNEYFPNNKGQNQFFNHVGKNDQK